MSTNWPADQSQLVIEQVADAIIVADREGCVRVWNAGAEAVFGYAEREALGQRLDLIVPERFRSAHWTAFDRAIATGQTKHGGEAMTTRSVTKDGTDLYVEISFALVRDGAGEVLGVVAVAAMLRLAIRPNASCAGGSRSRRRGSKPYRPEADAAKRGGNNVRLLGRTTGAVPATYFSELGSIPGQHRRRAARAGHRDRHCRRPRPTVPVFGPIRERVARRLSAADCSQRLGPAVGSYVKEPSASSVTAAPFALVPCNGGVSPEPPS